MKFISKVDGTKNRCLRHVSFKSHIQCWVRGEIRNPFRSRPIWQSSFSDTTQNRYSSQNTFLPPRGTNKRISLSESRDLQDQLTRE